MPCFSGSFSTTTWFHSTPFTFTIPRELSPPAPPPRRPVRTFSLASLSQGLPFAHPKKTRTRSPKTREPWESNQNNSPVFGHERQTLTTGTWFNTAFARYT
jgi:hypothetical protein